MSKVSYIYVYTSIKYDLVSRDNSDSTVQINNHIIYNNNI